MAKKKNTIGVRLNNPGNLKWMPGSRITPWQGLTEQKVVQTASGWFYEFDDAVYGIRAAARTLINYQDNHKIRIIDAIIKRYAPSNENDTQAYINAVVKATGFTSQQILNMHEYEYLFPVLKAIIKHENGYHPYTDAQIDAGLLLAGVRPQGVKDLKGSRTIKGAQISTLGVMAAGAAETLTEVRGQLEPLVMYADIVKWTFLVVALAGIACTVYARWDDHRKGLR